MIDLAHTSLTLDSIWDVSRELTYAPLERGGYNNTLYAVTNDARIEYVLKVYGNHANPALIQHEEAILLSLQQHRLPFAVPTPILTRRGEPHSLIVTPEGRALLMLIPFFEGDAPDIRDVNQARAVGEALAKLHKALKKVDTRGLRLPQSQIELDKVHPLVPHPLEAIDELGSLMSASTKSRVRGIYQRIEEEAPQLYRTLSKQLTHTDVIPGNMLLRGQHVTAFLDFENCAINPCVMDVAIALDAWSWGALGTGDEWARINAIGTGYSAVTRLTSAELDALPLLWLLRNANLLVHLIGRFLANLSPFVDVEMWVEAMLRVEAWLTMNAKRLREEARRW